MQRFKYGLLAIESALMLSPLGMAQQTLDAETQAKILKGFQIAPVSLSLTGRDATLVGLGSYIVNAVGE